MLTLWSLYQRTTKTCALPRTGRSRARCGSGSSSTGGDGDHAGAAGDFDVVARSSRFVARALQPHVVAHIAEGLIVEDKCGDPALEMDSGGDSCRASHGDL